MQVNYKYASPSMCLNQGDSTTLGLSPDLSREEKVSFVGKLKNPLLFRDAMLMLRQIVISNMAAQKIERPEFMAWLQEEIQRRMNEHESKLPNIREDISKEMDTLNAMIKEKEKEIRSFVKERTDLQVEIDKLDVWSEYKKLERDFWKFIYDRDKNLWFVLDPVITVHPDQVSFEAFSIDESTYGCLSVEMNEFDMIEPPVLGTTNIDFSTKLAKEMERFRTYTNVELKVNPGGFTVDTGVVPEYLEKKIDLPETWIKGFNQVSTAASLGGIDLELAPVDMYDICSFLRRNKEKKSPRYMKWILEPNQRIKILFEPFGKILELKAIYNGKRKREEKIWGRRRWLVMEKVIPLAKSFNIKFLGFGMPQFIIANMGPMKMTIGFTSWSSNDWVKGTAFNVMAGFIGHTEYENVYNLMKEKRFLSIDEIRESLNITAGENKSKVGMMLRKGEAYFDPIIDKIRFRQLCNVEIPDRLYASTKLELDVQKLLEQNTQNFKMKLTDNSDFLASITYKVVSKKYRNWSYYGTPEYNKQHVDGETTITIDPDGQISKLDCECSTFNQGPRNISSPCSHILALYVIATKFLHLEFKPNVEYKMNDILEMLL